MDAKTRITKRTGDKTMTRKEAKELLPVIQAFAEGKKIEYYDDEWIETSTPVWQVGVKYRIKPELKYRPFKNQKECWDEMLKHQPLGWIKNEYGNIFNIIAIFKESIKLNECSTYYSDLCKQFNFIDGTPFGIKKE